DSLSLVDLYRPDGD
ncbi:hypothetical protein A2U01_0029469, partial [Trifolium medium]|nr:hypothetical protein [Trifolium medium]